MRMRRILLLLGGLFSGGTRLAVAAFQPQPQPLRPRSVSFLHPQQQHYQHQESSGTPRLVSGGRRRTTTRTLHAHPSATILVTTTTNAAPAASSASVLLWKHGITTVQGGRGGRFVCGAASVPFVPTLSTTTLVQHLRRGMALALGTLVLLVVNYRKLVDPNSVFQAVTTVRGTTKTAAGTTAPLPQPTLTAGPTTRNSSEPSTVPSSSWRPSVRAQPSASQSTVPSETPSTSSRPSLSNSVKPSYIPSSSQQPSLSSEPSVSSIPSASRSKVPSAVPSLSTSTSSRWSTTTTTRKRTHEPHPVPLLAPRENNNKKKTTTNTNDNAKHRALRTPPRRRGTWSRGTAILILVVMVVLGRTAYFYHQMAKKLQYPRMWLYSFLGHGGIVVSGGTRRTKFLQREFLSADDGGVYAGMKASKIITADSLLSALRRLVGAAMTPARIAASIPTLQAAAELQVANMVRASSSSEVMIMDAICNDYTVDVAWKQLLGLDLPEEEIPHVRAAVEAWIAGFTSLRMILNLGNTEQHPAMVAKRYIEAFIRAKMMTLETQGRPDASTVSGMVFARDDEEEAEEAAAKTATTTTTTNPKKGGPGHR